LGEAVCKVKKVETRRKGERNSQGLMLVWRGVDYRVSKAQAWMK